MAGVFDGPAANGHGRSPSEDLPTVRLDTVFHVGTMDKANKRSISLEGNGRAVSLHPNDWRYMDHGWSRGDHWKLTRPGNLFLDMRALSEGQRSRIIEWGVAGQ